MENNNDEIVDLTEKEADELLESGAVDINIEEDCTEE